MSDVRNSDILITIFVWVFWGEGILRMLAQEPAKEGDVSPFLAVIPCCLF